LLLITTISYGYFLPLRHWPPASRILDTFATGFCAGPPFQLTRPAAVRRSVSLMAATIDSLSSRFFARARTLAATSKSACA
jgi:hypothetical protein